MENIRDLLPQAKFAEPPEVATIKEYVKEKYSVAAKVSIQDKQITIIAPSAALAGALRPQLLQLQALCHTDKKIIIRIGN